MECQNPDLYPRGGKKGARHPSNHKVFVARGATFLEREFLLEENYSREIELDEVQETNESTQNQDHEIQVEEPLLDLLKLTRKFPYSTVEVQELNVVQEQVNELVLNQIEQQPNPTQDDISNEVDHSDDDPKSYEEAIQNSDYEKCQKAIEFEMESMKENKVWTLVEPSKDIKPIGCK
ncbi:uncharacterized protein [Nicotiana sylvestris]|uniref:uncharacterized protein n=1 Tax=Nicotiana sylvestris TaxID=4096 RepID=UPI00388CAA42